VLLGINSPGFEEQLQESISIGADTIQPKKTLMLNNLYVDMAVTSIDSDFLTRLANFVDPENANDDIQLFMPGATATVGFDISNLGAKPENLTLTYWSTDPTGSKTYRGSQSLYLVPAQHSHRTIQVPYGLDGNYNLVVQGVTADGASATTDLSLNVSWLVVYLGPVAALAIAIIAISAGYVTYRYRQSRYPVSEMK
jgi:hypothetical protein